MDSIQIGAFANELHLSISSCTIQKIWMAGWYKKRLEKHPEYNVSGLLGWTFTSVIRVGKSLLFRLENPGIGNRYLANRLGLSGIWKVRALYPEITDEAIIFDLSHPQGRIFLSYHDPRRFGTIEVRENEGDLESLRSYGPEIRSNQFTKEWVTFFCGRHGVPIKQILLRPEYCPGISNWVASEVLFIAHIHPLALGKDLTREQVKRLFEALHLCSNGLKMKNVWEKSGKLCFVCRSVIEKVMIDRRGTYFCPSCQSKDWQPPRPVPKEFVDKVVQGIL